MARGSIEYKSTANEVPNIVGICQEMEREVTLGVLAHILAEKQVLKEGTRTVALKASRFILGR